MRKGREEVFSTLFPEALLPTQGTLKGTSLLSAALGCGVAGGQWVHGEVTGNGTEPSNGKLGVQYPKMDIGIHLVSIFFFPVNLHIC